MQYLSLPGVFRLADCSQDTSVLLQMAGYPSFSRLNNIPMCIYHIFIHSSIDRQLGCFHLMAILNNAAGNMDMQISCQYPAYISFG